MCSASLRASPNLPLRGRLRIFAKRYGQEFGESLDTKDFARLQLSQDEINEAWVTISRLHEMDDFIVNKAIIFASIVMYCRPFQNNNSNNGSVAKKIDFKSLNSPNKVTDLHNRILHFRDKMIAHSDGDFHDVKVIDGYKKMIIRNNIPYNEIFKLGDEPKQHFEIILEILYAMENT